MALGIVANFPWEMAHSLLYRGATKWTMGRHLLCGGLAALTDGAGIAVIFGFGIVVFRDARWTRLRSLARLGFTALLGLAGAILNEWLALRLDWWGYGPTMPRVPGANLGITPLIQFMAMPLGVLFWALPLCWHYPERRRRSDDLEDTRPA
ncbi:MAG TPA: hypothetical protein VFB38_25390 [Chthonomonadaceae bacterium]|nr:hypothetical protein [Chthonomonadaceae bacterium]